MRRISEPGHTSEEQKAALLERFADFPSLGDRARRGLREEADDFYFTRIVQVKLDSWHNGRCALVGDAAYAPSPLTGQGTTLSILGSYILAGEMAKSPDDPASAFIEYEKELQGYVREEQKIPFAGRAPYMANPQTRTGILVSRTLFWVLAKSNAWKWFNIGTDKKYALPEYPFEDSSPSTHNVATSLRQAAVEILFEGFHVFNGMVDNAGPYPAGGGLHLTIDGHVQIHDSWYDRRDGALTLLRLKPGFVTRENVCEETKLWHAVGLESAALEAGVVIAALRSYEP
ncbi:hypothetical protein KC343_g7634 [Hortaea werneckii]|nr:hypothetical protein KC352_g17674 [Hortaea werneckii]KAI7571601.1 hypothetical protein KC317_g1499 [Hortaea werneckii]KAI7614549.1 hypothetical protein KC346_g6884 [Hortaea werneckii]KAI7622471.1 hypothetical protein KC343_g7634 [Hortaea werneckii]KAI7682077.1 hypothetical protein KC319_g1211 [Hortaea werneckii]